MKKLLIITDMFPDRDNHTYGIFVKNQVDELSKRYKVQVISTAIARKYKYKIEDSYGYDAQYILYPVFNRFFLSSILSYRFFVVPKVKREIIRFNPDIIHVHDCRHYPELYALNKYFETMEKSVFLTLHNIRTHPDKIHSRFFKYIYNYFLNRAFSNWTHVFVVNNQFRDLIKKIEPGINVSNIGNAINPIPLKDAEDLILYRKCLTTNIFRFLSVGNLVKEKGFDLLINAVYELKVKGINVQLVIVGEGSERINLEQQIDVLGLNNNVCLLGRIDNDIVRNMYSWFSAFVLPSYSETFGIVYLEAMYAGIPVIGVKGQGIDGVIIDKVNGLLVNPKDVTDLVKNMEYVIANTTEVKAIAEAGKSMVRKNYMLSSLIDRLELFYES